MITVAMETVEEEQRRKHEQALSRVMKLEQEVTMEKEVSQVHIEEAKQVKVIVICVLLLPFYIILGSHGNHKEPVYRAS